MRLLAIHGSPRINGNTDAILERFLALAGESAQAPGGTPPVVEHIRAARLKASACLECGGCDKTGLCIVKDDMQRVYESVRNADALVVATPVFFTSLTAQLKALIDRFQCAWVAKYRLGHPWIDAQLGRRAVLLCAGGMKVDRHFEQVRTVVRSWLAVLNVKYAGGLWFPGVDAHGDSELIPGLDERLREAVAMLFGTGPNSVG